MIEDFGDGVCIVHSEYVLEHWACIDFRSLCPSLLNILLLRTGQAFLLLFELTEQQLSPTSNKGRSIARQNYNPMKGLIPY